MRAIIKSIPIYSRRRVHGCANKSQMAQTKDSIIVRGLALLIGIGALLVLFTGEVVSLPFSALFLAYGIGGSKFLKKIGLGKYTKE